MTAGIETDRLPDLPYPGIEPFNYAWRRVFFARDKEARSLMQLIAMYRGVLLYSDSGTGKSSLVNAGLIPLAVDRGLQPEKIRVQPRRGEELIVERLSKSVDDKRPFLPSLFAFDEQHERVVLSVEEFEKTLRQPELAVRPLLIFDQFEEWITLFEEDGKSEAANEARIAQKSIREAIVSLINDRELRVKVLIALREDYLAKLNPLFEQCPSLPDQYLRLTAFSGDQIYRAIRGPFEEHPGRYRVEVGPALAKQIQEQFEQRSEGADVHLTEVQIVCRSLFEAGISGQELDRYFADQGGVQGILERHLELALEALKNEQREPAVALLTRMLTSAGTRNVISEDDLVNRAENEDRIPRELLGKTLQSLEQEAKLIRRERRREVHYYEIASEFLVGWIRRRAQERQRLVEGRRLEEAQRRAQEQARIARRFRRLTAALVVMVVVAIGAAVYACHQVRVAEKAKEQAEKQRMVAEKAKEQAEEQRMVAEKAKEEADTLRSKAALATGGAVESQTTVLRFAERFQQAKTKAEQEEILAAIALELSVVTNSIGMKLVYIPAGSFWMGSGEPAAQLAKEYKVNEVSVKNEFPWHPVRISEGFWMGQTEVTQGQYKSVMNAQPWSGQNSVQVDANNPAVYVSWDDAVEFCRRLSQQEGKIYRLPTEAEWEYACRAGTKTRFSFGDGKSSPGDYAWYRGNAIDQKGQGFARPVGRKQPNPWGLYDMHGNVLELCSDWYDANYYSGLPRVDPKGSSSPFSQIRSSIYQAIPGPPRVDPKGSSSGTNRSMRGGSWDCNENLLRCSVRFWLLPTYRNPWVGFRVVSQPKTYSLTATAAAAHGSVRKSPDKAAYNHGETVTLNAEPNKEYSFTNWSGDLSGSTNPVTLVMDADKSVSASFALKAARVVVWTPPGFYIHNGCVEFRDQDDVIIKGPITLVRVCHGDYIYGLQLRYGSRDGSFFGLKTTEYGLRVTEWPVPPREQIARVEGQIATYGSGFLYVSRLRFITDKGTPSPLFGGTPGTPFVAPEDADKNRLLLRTISGWANPRQHPSLKRAITSMTFHFGSGSGG